MNWTRSALQIVALPRHPPPGKIFRVLSTGSISSRSWYRLGSGGGGRFHQVNPVHPVTELPVVSQEPHLQVCVALRSEDLMVEPLTVGVPLPHHPEAVGLRIVTAERASRLTRHAHHIGQIGADSHAVEQLRQCVKITLEAC